MARRRAGHKLSWWESDAKYKARGRRKAIQYNGEWNDECEEMNRFPDTFLSAKNKVL